MRVFSVSLLLTFSWTFCLVPCAVGEVIGESFTFVDGKKSAATIVIGSKAKTEDF